MNNKEQSRKISEYRRNMLWLYAVAGGQLFVAGAVGTVMLGELNKDSHLTGMVAAAVFACFLFEGIDNIELANNSRKMLRKMLRQRNNQR